MNSRTCFSTCGDTVILCGEFKYVVAERETASESDTGNFVSTRILTIPIAALRKAKGSLEPEGARPTAKQPTKESSLSASAKACPVMFLGMGSSRPAGLYWS